MDDRVDTIGRMDNALRKVTLYDIDRDCDSNTMYFDGRSARTIHWASDESYLEVTHYDVHVLCTRYPDGVCRASLRYTPDGREFICPLGRDRNGCR